MASKIADLLPSPVEVEVSKGKTMTLRHLELQEIVSLLFSHANDFLAMYAESQTEKPNYVKFVSLAPQLCADAIAMANNDVENRADYRKLPFAVQLIALNKLWEVSVPNPKLFGETLKVLGSELKRLSESAEAEKSQALASSKTPA